MSTLLHDLRYGLRMLAKNPGLTAAVVLTLALGIGANTAMFSVLNSLLLRPLPVTNPEQLVALATRIKGSSELHDLSYPDFLDCGNQATAFSDMLAYEVGNDGLAADNRADRVMTSYVSGNYFSMLGIQPALGRLIEVGEGQKPGADPVLVLGYSYWQRRFSGDPRVVGKAVLVDGRSVTVVGVVPQQFRGAFSLAETDVYLPISQLALQDKGFWTARGARGVGGLRVLARVKPDVSLKQARASLDVVARRLAQQYPETDKNVSMEAYPERLARPQPSAVDAWPPMVAVFSSLGLIVLLVASINVANILLVRANAREGEMAIRSALGAGRGRLVRQLLTETVMLALMGGAAGILLSTWVSKLLSSICTPIDLPFQMDFHPDWRVFAYAFGITLLAGAVVGLIPARRAWRSNLNVILHEGGRAPSGSLRLQRKRNTLVVLQVGASMVLLILAGLFVRSLEKAEHMDLGFDPHHILNLSMDLHQIGFDEGQGTRFYQELAARVRALPGVESATYAYSWPLCHYYRSASVYIEGQAPLPGQAAQEVVYNIVDPAYFNTLRIPILRGRAFTDTDNDQGQRVAIINQAMADRFWAGRDPLGKRFSMEPKSPLLEVVGVARNAKQATPTPQMPPYFYVPVSQNYSSQLTLQVRAPLPPEMLRLEVEGHVHALASDLPVFDVRTMDEALQGAGGFFLFRLGANVAAGLGILGLLLAVIGVYGVVSYAASRRTREIGIRIALGARNHDILRMVLRQGVWLVGTGLLGGLFVALGVTRVASSLLVISTMDPVTFVVAPLLLGGIGLLACYLPARRATKVDPMEALRYE
jgi:predicted permease